MKNWPARKGEREEKLELFIPPGPRLGNVVIEATNVSKAYGDKVLFEDLSFSLPPAGIVGIIGPNGAGKTTLFRLITGQEQPDAGTFRVGETVALGYVDQMHDDLEPKNRFGKTLPVVTKLLCWATVRLTHGLMYLALTLTVPISKRRWAYYQAASVTGCIWPSH
jgi:ATPase subunit of ABC transporter with duplicated ATPase domains